jgi:DNA/RNA-binding domain of Phe-tRNA-synthetase-like protein
MKLIVDEPVLNRFESITIGVIRFKVSSVKIKNLSEVITGIKNNAVMSFLEQYGNCEANQIPQVKRWTDIFQAMSAKKGRVSSIIFLSNYVLDKKSLFNISPFVDLYNSISLKYGMPMGGYNVDNFTGDIKLRLAHKGEEFYGIGSKQVEKTSANEVVYSDEQGVFCRCWNDKDSDRTKITSDIKDLLFIFDGIDQKNEIEKAIFEIRDILSLTDYIYGVADKFNPFIEI